MTEVIKHLSAAEREQMSAQARRIAETPVAQVDARSGEKFVFVAHFDGTNNDKGNIKLSGNLRGFLEEALKPIKHWLQAVVLGVVVMGTQSACSEDQQPRWAFHGLSYNQAVDMPQVDILDCLYGNALGAHTQREVDEGLARRGECGNIFGTGPIGDFLYVKWRDKATGQVYEDRVDLKSRLPSAKEMHGQTIYFLIDDNQLYVYLIPDSDIEGKRNHLPPGQPANGPDGWDYLDVTTLYPDNAPAKVRGGRPGARAAREAAERAKP